MWRRYCLNRPASARFLLCKNGQGRTADSPVGTCRRVGDGFRQSRRERSPYGTVTRPAPCAVQTAPVSDGWSVAPEQALHRAITGLLSLRCGSPHSSGCLPTLDQPVVTVWDDRQAGDSRVVAAPMFGTSLRILFCTWQDQCGPMRSWHMPRAGYASGRYQILQPVVAASLAQPLVPFSYPGRDLGAARSVLVPCSAEEELMAYITLTNGRPTAQGVWWSAS